MEVVEAGQEVLVVVRLSQPLVAQVRQAVLAPAAAAVVPMEVERAPRALAVLLVPQVAVPAVTVQQLVRRLPVQSVRNGALLTGLAAVAVVCLSVLLAQAASMVAVVVVRQAVPLALAQRASLSLLGRSLAFQIMQPLTVLVLYLPVRQNLVLAIRQISQVLVAYQSISVEYWEALQHIPVLGRCPFKRPAPFSFQVYFPVPAHSLQTPLLSL